MTIEMLQYFICTASYEHFSRAAQHLFISQPNLSRQIAQMEEEVGCKLFVHQGRGVKLTDAGKYFYEAVKNVPDLVAAACEGAKARAQQLDSISIGILEGQLLNNALAAIQSQYPSVRFRIEKSSFRSLRNGLQNGLYDIIITLTFDVSEMKDITCLTMPSGNSVIAINRFNPKASACMDVLKGLEEETLLVISPEESPIGYRRTMQMCRDLNISPSRIQYAFSIEELLLGVETNAGYAFVDNTIQLQQDPNIFFLPIGEGVGNGICVAYKNSSASKLIQEIADDMSRFLTKA